MEAPSRTDIRPAISLIGRKQGKCPFLSVIVSKATVSNTKVVLENYTQSNNKTVFAVSNKQQYETVLNLLGELGVEFELLNSLQIPKKKI